MLENLSLIPGNVGASPMQNIGAYGVEIDDVFWDLEAYHLKEKKRVTFTRSDCEFGYRESVFKRKYKDQEITISVTHTHPPDLKPMLTRQFTDPDITTSVELRELALKLGFKLIDLEMHLLHSDDPNAHVLSETKNPNNFVKLGYSLLGQ